MSSLNPPFVHVEGTFNFRSVGGYPIPSNLAFRVKTNFLFRSGELSGITPAGAKALALLNVNTVFDLRAKNESDKWQATSPHLTNIEIVHAPVYREVNYSPDFLAEYLSKFEKDELNAFLDLYREMLANLGSALEAVIRRLVEHSEHPILVHCTAGKDRTGMLVAVILLLLGVADSEVAEEYALTEVGLKPVHEMLACRLARVEAFRNNPVGTLNMGKSRGETMIAVTKMLRAEYGSIEEYVFRVTSLTRDDIKALRERGLVDAS